MTINTLTPFPYTLGGITNITPFTYRDGLTFLEKLEKMREYLNETLVPDAAENFDTIIKDFQTGITNAELTINTAKAGWDTAFSETSLEWNSAFAEKQGEWTTRFDGFMADITNQLAGLNDSAFAGLVGNVTSASYGALATFADARADDRISATVGPNLKALGVVSDGFTTTGTALTVAMNLANAMGVPLRLPKGRYAFDQVSIPSGMTVEGSGPETVIVQSVAAQATFQAIGTHSLLGSLTEDLVKGATTINVLQSWGLVPGDLIMVLDTASYAATDTAYKSGEQFRVKSSTGTTITLTTPVRGSFTATGSYAVANGAVVRKITPVKNVTLRNMAFEGHSAGIAPMLRFQCVDGLTLENISTISGQAGFCTLDMVRNVSARNWTLNGLVDNWASGYPGYGFIIRHASHNVRISDGVSNMARHAITTIGGPYGAPRNLVFGPNIISDDSTSTAAIDTHSSGEGVTIHGNVISNAINGIAIRARNVQVFNNRVSKSVSCGIMVNEDARDVIIRDNFVPDSVALAIRVGAGGSVHTNVAVMDNTVDNCGSDAIGVTQNCTNVRIVGNVINSAGKQGIVIDATCTDILIESNKINGAGVLVGPTPGINITGAEVVGTVDIIGNVIRQKTALMNRAIYTTRTSGRMVGNKAFGPYASAGTEFFGGTGFVKDDNMLYA